MPAMTRNNGWRAPPGVAHSASGLHRQQAVDAASNATFDCISPIDGRLLAKVASCGITRIWNARWLPAQLRGWGLVRAPAGAAQEGCSAAELMQQYRAGTGLAGNAGHGQADQRRAQVDLPASVRCMSWTAEAIDKVYGEVAPTGQMSWG